MVSVPSWPIPIGRADSLTGSSSHARIASFIATVTEPTVPFKIPQAVLSDHMGLADYVTAIPKAELHLHLEGSIQPQTLLELADRNGITLPYSSVDQIRAACTYRDFRQFVDAILMHARAIRRPRDLSLVSYRIGEQMAAQNIRYAEVTWTPQIYLGLGEPFSTLLDALNDGRRRATDQWGVDMRWIPDIVRSLSVPADSLVQSLCGAQARAGGVVALGLGGIEAEHPPETFADCFRRARELGVVANPHAGEFAGPSSVWGALRALKASRIGHGVRSVEDPQLVRFLADHRIPLEVCPTSNVRLNVVASYEAHPLELLVESGCRVTINSDDPVLFDTTLSAEYLHAVEDCGLTLDQLETCALEAVSASYLPQQRKASMLEGFRSDYARLRSVHGV